MDDRDEAWVEDEYYTDEIRSSPGPPPQSSYTEYYWPRVKHFVVSYLYGWDLYVFVALLIGFCVFYKRVIKWYLIDVGEEIRQWKAARQYAAEAAKLKKNPDLCRARIEAFETVRAKQQALHDVKAEEFAGKEAEKEDKKRRDHSEQLEQMVRGKGYNNRSRRVANAKPPSSLLSDYNPLMGSGRTSGYRPARRDLGSSGG